MQQDFQSPLFSSAGRKKIQRTSCVFSQPYQGFTLIELLISCAIVCTLCAIAIPNVLAAINQARIARAVGDIRSIGDDLTAYAATNYQFPNGLGAVGDANHNDPWGNPYKYLNFANATPNQMRKNRFLFPFNTYFDLYSMGPDGKTQLGLTAPESQDDIVWANDGDYVGVASEY
jgi:general secretion pathway protein G